MEIYLKAKSLTLSSVASRKLFWSQISQGSWPVSFKCIDEPPILIFLLLFFRRSTYNHLSSWLTDARNLTNPNTVMSSKCHTSCFFQFMHFDGACQEQDCKAL